MLKTICTRSCINLKIHGLGLNNHHLQYGYKLTLNFGGQQRFILSTGQCFKHSVRTFLSDKERVRDFVTMLNPDEKSLLLQELNEQQTLNESTPPPDQLKPQLNVDEVNKFIQDKNKQRDSPKPTIGQLRKLAIHQSLPFIGFGFLDNLIMILAGDYIDLTIGVTFGISTMAAAGLGNALSDVAGVGSAYYVERLSDKVGVKSPKLSLVQLQMPRTRWATQLGRAFGVTIGCIIGMFPLLFIPHREDISH